MDANEITEITTTQQALNYLLDIARAEAETLNFAAKLYTTRPTQCPPDVRKKAHRRRLILDAIKLVQERPNAY